MSVILLTCSLLPFYLLGCISSGRIVARFYGVSLEKQGSGNIGATNVARTLGRKPGLLTLVGDILKGVTAVFLARFISDDPHFSALAAVSVVAGHCFSIPPILKGGKGVATAFGAYLGLAPLLALMALGCFAAVFAWKRIVSLASLSAAVSVPTFVIFIETGKRNGGDSSLFFATAVISLIVIARHRENLKRLIEGTECQFKTASTTTGEK